MLYSNLQQESIAYNGALQTEAVISGRHLHTAEKSLRIVFAVLSILGIAFLLMKAIPAVQSAFPAFFTVAGEFFPLFKSIFLITAGLWLWSALWYAFFASFYFRDEDATLPEMSMRQPPIRFEVAKVITSGCNEPVLDFLVSRYGSMAMLRLGLSKEEVIAFIKDRARPSGIFDIGTSDEPIGLGEFAKELLRYDEGLKHFLLSRKIEADDFVGAAGWVSHNESDRKKYQRWWGKDALGRIPGIGKDWGYGEIILLSRYAISIARHPTFSSWSKGAFGKHEAEEVERILSRGRETNVLLVGEEGVPKLAPLARLQRKISAGTVLPPLEHKEIYVFNGAPFVSAMKEKAVFETEFIKLLSEAARAGNIIFVFDNFEKFYEGANAIGSDALSILDPFLTSKNIQIVAIVELGAFRQVFEPNAKVKERFERVLIAEAGVSGSIPILEEEAIRAEAKHGVIFTYPALRAVAESADRYFFEGVMPDKAIDLLLELVPQIKSAGKSIVLKDDVLDLVSSKTGIAASEAKGEERTKLLKLEEILHERIVGQEEAVKAISGALRRARSGISSKNRPIGSFLFLGPTGVGKTETTKALAQAFFGDEKSIVRLDMSEYHSDDALNRLIGTFEGGKAGVLASLIREHPYGVLLLDEFEKTSREVHDLFLQILDEGFFTDVFGKRVNARNLMIIATSNAGSDLIWNMAQEGKRLDKDIIIAEIINRAIFKPELLNRFDGVILFHPLNDEHLRLIARLQLEKLGKRLKEKGLEFLITDPLVEYLVSAGQDPKFGARPMARAIQGTVEQAIAEKMLRGEIVAGSTVELSPSDFPQGITSFNSSSNPT